MPDTKITALTALTTADPATDMFPVVDVSDTTMAASGTTKRISINNILACSPTATLASATISGDLTVRTNKLAVTSTGVGFGTTTPTGVADFLSAIVGNSNVLTIGNNEYGAATYLNSNSVSLTFNRGPSFKTGAVVSSNVTSGNLSEGYIAFQTSTSNVLTERYRIDNTGISTWSVGGSTAMTLNATGLGVGVTPAAGDGSGVFKAAGTGTLTASSRAGLDVRELVSGNQAGIILGAMTTENTGVIGSRTASGNIAFQTYNGSAWGERMRIDYLGNLLVGTTTNTNSSRVFARGTASSSALALQGATGDVALAQLTVGKFDNNTTTSQVFVRFTINDNSGGSGQINANGASQAAFGSFSDSRLKQNIANLPSQLANILSLRPVEFDYKDGSGHQIGFVAQEMQEVYSDAVGEQNGFLTVTGWGKTEARLVSAIKELAAKVQALEAKLA